MKLLFENWRRYLLTERYSEATALESLKPNSKKMRNLYKRYINARWYEDVATGVIDPEWEPEPKIPEEKINKAAAGYRAYILEVIPEDIWGQDAVNPVQRKKEADKNIGLAIMWIRKLSIENPKIARDIIDGEISYSGRGGEYSNMMPDLEIYFQNLNLMPKRNLIEVGSIEELHQMVEATKDEIEARRQKQIKSPDLVKEGTIFLRGGWYQPTTSLKGDLSQEEKLETVPENGWVIMEIHNKAASCFHGTADWCTAAPGLDYFEEYYKPTDPLFIFQRVPDIDKDRPQFLQHGHKTHPGGEEKYQFHYGTKSFMDRNDHYVNNEVWLQLHNLLMQTAAPEKYPVVQNHHYYMVAEDRESPPEELDAMAKNPDVPGSVKTRIAKNPATPLETLEYLSRSDNKFVRRAVMVNHAIDPELTIKMFVNNIDDELIYSRGMNSVIRLIKDKKISQQRGAQILSRALDAYVDHKAKIKADFDKRAEANKKEKSVGSLYEHKIKIRVKK